VQEKKASGKDEKRGRDSSQETKGIQTQEVDQGCRQNTSTMKGGGKSWMGKKLTGGRVAHICGGSREYKENLVRGSIRNERGGYSKKL